MNVYVIKIMGNWKILIILFLSLVISVDVIWYFINLVICILKRINGFIGYFVKLFVCFNCYINIKCDLLYIYDLMIIKNI